MQPRVTIPMLGVVDADAARTAPNGMPAGMAMPILVDVRERHEFAAIRAPGGSPSLLRMKRTPVSFPSSPSSSSG